jgi:hypothetical protein
VTIDVTPTSAGDVSNTASVSSSTPDSTSANDSSSLTTHVIAATADLSLTNVDFPDPRRLAGRSATR